MEAVEQAVYGDILKGFSEEFTYDRTKLIVNGQYFHASSIKNMLSEEREAIKEKMILKAFSNIIRRTYNVQIRADELNVHEEEFLLQSFKNAREQIGMMLEDNSNQLDFITKDDIRELCIRDIYTNHDNELFLRINIKNIHITPKSLGRIHLSDAVIIVTNDCNFHFYEKATVFGKPCLVPLHHPHISSDAHPCAGGFKNDFEEYIKNGNIFLLYGALRAFLVKFNGNSPYWDPIRILSRRFTYSDENGNTLANYEFEGKERADFENGYWNRDYRNTKYIFRKDTAKIFEKVLQKTRKAGFGMYECSVIVYLIILSLEHRLGNPANNFDDVSDYKKYLEETKQKDTLNLLKKEMKIREYCEIEENVHQELRYNRIYYDSRIHTNVHVDITPEFCNLVSAGKLLQLNIGIPSEEIDDKTDLGLRSVTEKWKDVFDYIPSDMVHYFTKKERSLKVIKYVNDCYEYIMNCVMFENGDGLHPKRALGDIGFRDLPDPNSYVTIKKTALNGKEKKLDDYLNKVKRLRVLFKRDLYNSMVSSFRTTMERMKEDAKHYDIFSESEMQEIDKSIIEQQTP